MKSFWLQAQPFPFDLIPFYVIALGLTLFSFGGQPDRWYWRMLTGTLVLLAMSIRWAVPQLAFLGALLPFALPYLYFVVFQRRQYTLIQLFLFILLVGALFGAAFAPSQTVASR